MGKFTGIGSVSESGHVLVPGYDESLILALTIDELVTLVGPKNPFVRNLRLLPWYRVDKKGLIVEKLDTQPSLEPPAKP